MNKVGGSVMLPIPPEMLGELALRVGSEVKVTSGEACLGIEPAAPSPSPEVVESMRRFVGQYDEILRNLADR